MQENNEDTIPTGEENQDNHENNNDGDEGNI
jgi:hypothetical protein